MNINIMRAFVAIRNYVFQQSEITKDLQDLWKAVNDLSEDNRKEFDDIYLALSELADMQRVNSDNTNKSRRLIGYQHYNK